MSKTVVAIFDSYEYAENAARQIKDRGLRTDDISLVAKQGNEGEEGTDTGMKQGNGMEAGAAGATGAIGGIGAGAGMGAAGRTGNEEGAERGAPRDNISGGVLTGGVLGGLAGLLIGAGSMVVPGLGIVAAAGPITGLLSGAVTGGIIGGLVDLGIPENRGRQYEADIKAGKILFSMRTDEDKVDEIASILRNNGAVSVDAY